jgi:hypothetical protein
MRADRPAAKAAGTDVDLGLGGEADEWALLVSLRTRLWNTAIAFLVPQPGNCKTRLAFSYC